MFFTVLAWVVALFSAVRIYYVGIASTDEETAGLIIMAEAMGGNPVGEALKWPAILFVVSAIWIITGWVV